MENRIYSKVFSWLFIGLMITFVSGYCLSLNQTLLYQVLSIGIIPIVIIELVIALVMGFKIRTMNPIVAKICYIVYSLITGVTFGSIFYAYEVSSVIFVFLVTSLIFGLLALYGYITKRDVTKISTILFVTLIAGLVISVLNLFIFKSSQLDTLLSIIMLVVFMGYVIYDMKAIKYLVNSMDEDNAAVYGAFQLYLDFINIFIRLLEFIGKEKDR